MKIIIFIAAFLCNVLIGAPEIIPADIQSVLEHVVSPAKKINEDYQKFLSLNDPSHKVAPLLISTQDLRKIGEELMECEQEIISGLLNQYFIDQQKLIVYSATYEGHLDDLNKFGISIVAGLPLAAGTVMLLSPIEFMEFFCMPQQCPEGDYVVTEGRGMHCVKTEAAAQCLQEVFDLGLSNFYYYIEGCAPGVSSWQPIPQDDGERARNPQCEASVAMTPFAGGAFFLIPAGVYGSKSLFSAMKMKFKDLPQRDFFKGNQFINCLSITIILNKLRAAGTAIPQEIIATIKRAADFYELDLDAGAIENLVMDNAYAIKEQSFWTTCWEAGKKLFRSSTADRP